MPLALVTGASTGIGEATALRLAGGGWTVLAGVREQAAGERLLEGAAAGSGASGDGASTSACAGKLIPLLLDVTDAEQIAAAADRVRAEARANGGGGLGALVNNAGIGIGGPLEVVGLQDLRTQLEVNVVGPVAVTQALLPELRRAQGRIVFVSSIGGRVSTPFVAPYAASKHAVEAIADALRIELRRSGVRVALVEPGSVATPIWGKAQEEAQRLSIPPELSDAYAGVAEAMTKTLEDTARRGVPPERVAETIERALTARRMKARYPVGRDTKAILLMRRMLPDTAWDRVIRRAMGV
jgi:NAD(P)-dependent dehydrogenase (short-subunit alcohol dehydrogenase family)